MYAAGTSETTIGKWLSKRDRQQFVIATKVFAEMDKSNPNSGGLSRKSIMWNIDESLKRLQTDYVDLFQIHMMDPGTPAEEVVRALDDLVGSGKVRYIGSSNTFAYQLQKNIDTCKHLRLNRWITLQMQYNLMSRDLEREHLHVCRKEGLGLLPYSPLYGGWLTGKFKRDQVPSTDSRVGTMEKGHLAEVLGYSEIAKQEWVWKLLDKMKELALAKGKSVPQVALRWLLQKDVVCSVIIGCKTIKQLEDNVGAATGWELSKEEMDALDELSAPKPSHIEIVMQMFTANRQRSSCCQ